MAKKRIIRGNELAKMIRTALGLSDDLPTRRIIVDVALDDAVTVYVEGFGTQDLESVDWSAGLAASNVMVVQVPGKFVGKDSAGRLLYRVNLGEGEAEENQGVEA